jgi:predicted transcriptional regulator
MPDDPALATTHISMRAPSSTIDAIDRIAELLDRPRSWVIVRALRHYVEEGEGARHLEEDESIKELDRGEGEPFGTIYAEMREIIKAAARRQARPAGKVSKRRP